ncbi:MAG: hypothetical protein HUJ77_06400 [Clostridium sp.]|uniref:polymer-forming cytoskeletal protein n=1 Tax=Clostridium sp. TaxID=1506 RepID=UPI0025BA56E8|nr:polymer-forming cytoskeletal protein [Clostridium sp.]MCF0148014.1 hypothetical protein [Clostridium sp.]
MSEKNTNILGDGTIGAGKYNNIKIMGDSTVTGNIECIDIVIMGNGEFHGAVDARDIKVMGDSIFKGTIKARKFKIYGDSTLKEKGTVGILSIKGDFKSEGDLEVKDKANIMGDAEIQEGFRVNYIEILGELKASKNIYFDTLKVLGSAKVKGNCEGNYFYNKGEIEISGLLSADKIEILPKRESRIEEIGGSEIIIKKTGYIDFYSGKVISKLIEGDKIILENTICNIVRGHDITILSGCSIDKIEYTGKLTIDKKSKVGEQICLRN